MNWKANFFQYTLLIILNLLFLSVFFLFILHHFEKYAQHLETSNKKVLGVIDKLVNINKGRETLKTLEYKELSPDESKEILVYKMKFNSALYDDYYKEYFPNKKIIAVRHLDNQQEDIVFTGDERTGSPHWLGNEYIFFTSYCGTACQGVYLIDTGNKETRQGVWGYIFSDEENHWETHFQDWFGKEFVFVGMIDRAISEIIDEQSYLVFELKDGNGGFIGEKRFLFTEDELRE